MRLNHTRLGMYASLVPSQTSVREESERQEDGVRNTSCLRSLAKLSQRSSLFPEEREGRKGTQSFRTCRGIRSLCPGREHSPVQEKRENWNERSAGMKRESESVFSRPKASSRTPPRRSPSESNLQNDGQQQHFSNDFSMDCEASGCV